MRPEIQKSLKEAIRVGQLIAFDTETTGLSSENDYITEIAAVQAIVQPDGVIHSRKVLHEYIRVPVTLSQKIVELTGITDEFLRDKPTEDEIFNKIYDFFGESPILLGHNVPFDIKMLSAMYKRHGKSLRPLAVLDTLPMARDQLKDITNHKLQTVAEYYGLTTRFHSAIGDVAVTGKIANILMPYYLTKSTRPLIQAHIRHAKYWSLYQNQRVYCDTDYGNLYIDYRKKCWGGDGVNIDEYDVDYLEKQLKALASTDDLHQALRYFYDCSKKK